MCVCVWFRGLDTGLQEPPKFEKLPKIKIAFSDKILHASLDQVYSLMPNFALTSKGDGHNSPPKFENLVEIAIFQRFFAPHGRFIIQS